MDWGNYLERRGWWWIRDQLGIGQQGVRNCIVFACLTCVLSPSLLLLFITISSSSIIIISTLFQLENHSYLNMSSILFSWFSSHPLVRWDVGSEWVAVWCLVQSDCVQKEKGTTWNYHQEFSMKIRKTNHQNCVIYNMLEDGLLNQWAENQGYFTVKSANCQRKLLVQGPVHNAKNGKNILTGEGIQPEAILSEMGQKTGAGAVLTL